MIDTDFVCEKISKLRIQRGVSARDMSLSLGQSPGYINNIENKNNLPSLQMLLYICEYLRISPMEFFNEKEYPVICNDIKEISSELTSEQQELLLNVAKEFNQRK